MWPAQQPITKWFSKAVAIDYPTHSAIANEAHLQDWGITFEEAFATGIERLRESTLPKFRQQNGVWVSTWDDDYDSSRVLLPGIFDDLPLHGEPVVVIPNRLTLMVCGSEEPDALRVMFALAEAVVREKPKPQNTSPLAVRDGQILDFAVPPDSPVLNDVERAQKFAALATYED